MKEAYDVAVIGGGTVGSVLCMLLAQIRPSTRILLVDKGAAPPPNKTFSITRGGVLVLKTAGVWDELEALAYPVTGAEVSMAGAFGMFEAHSADLGAESLGHSLFAPDMDRVLRGRVGKIPGCEHLEAEFLGASSGNSGVLLRLDIGGEPAHRTAKACVITSCAEPALRTSGFRRRTHNYGQAIVACRVEGTPAAEGLAVERFADDGAYAFVPHKGECGLMVCTTPERVRHLMGLPDAQLLARILAKHNRALFSGPAKIRSKSSFPLGMSAASPAHVGRTCLLGSALLSVHPIGGQGLNLALRDAYVWAELHDRIAEPAALMRKFRALRACDRRRVALSTHTTARFARAGGRPLRGAAALGLQALSALRPLRRASARSIFLGNMRV